MQYPVDDAPHRDVGVNSLHPQPHHRFGSDGSCRVADDLGQVEALHDVPSHTDKVDLLQGYLGEVDLLQGGGNNTAEVDLVDDDGSEIQGDPEPERQDPVGRPHAPGPPRRRGPPKPGRCASHARLGCCARAVPP